MGTIHIDDMQNDSAANINTNTTALQIIIYRVRQKDLPHFKRQLQTNKERYGKNTLICEQQI
jgi:hypothetical protein